LGFLAEKKEVEDAQPREACTQIIFYDLVTNAEELPITLGRAELGNVSGFHGFAFCLQLNSIFFK
jgi:hypothetical protein